MAAEAKKIKLVQQILAVIQLIRTLQIGWSFFIYQGRTFLWEETIYLLITTALLVLLFFRKFQVIVPLLCAIVIPKFDQVFLVPSIADNLFSFFCLFFIFYYLKVEKPDITPVEKKLRTQVLYWYIFLAYAGINLMSAFVHLTDPYWSNGTAIERLLDSSTVSRFFYIFRQFHTTSWFTILMQIVTWLVVISQCIIIPLYLFKVTRNWVLIWMGIVIFVIFELLSVVLLPHYTALLAFLLFYNSSEGLFGLKLIKYSLTNAMRKTSIIFYAIIGFQIIVNTPVLKPTLDKVVWLTREWDTRIWLSKKIALFGFGQPQVLNQSDIEGANRWFVVYRYEDDTAYRVPFTKKNGSYVMYHPDFLMFGNQGSDFIKKNLVAYGNYDDTLTYNNSQTPYKEKGRATDRLIRYDYFARHCQEVQHYRLDFYRLQHPIKPDDEKWDYTDTLTETKHFACKGGIVWPEY